MRQGVSVSLVLSTAGQTGVESVVLLLARELKALGACIRVLTFTKGSLTETLAQNKIAFDILPIRSKFSITAIFQLYRYFTSSTFDVVHSHGARAMFFANPAARMAHVPVVLTTLHELADAKSAHTRMHGVYRRLESAVSRRHTDMLVANSDAVYNDAFKMRSLPRDKTTRIYNGLDTDRFTGSPALMDLQLFKANLGLVDTDVAIGVVGRLSTIKGQRYAIEALPGIRRHVPTARLIIVGSGPEQNNLQHLAVERGIADHVIFTGSIADMRVLYHALDVVIVPSQQEAFGLVALEAMACGIPVAAANVGGLPEVVRPMETGLLFPAGDIQAITDAVVRLLSDPVLCAQMTLRARDRVLTHFSGRKIAEEYASLYEQLIDQHLQR